MTSINLSIDTPETDNWVKDFLLSKNIILTEVEGYSVKDEIVTGIFERRISSVPIDELLTFDGEFIKNLLIKDDSLEDIKWRNRIILANKLKVPLYVIIWYDNQDRFLIQQWNKSGEFSLAKSYIIDSCKKISIWFSDFKGIPVTKRFVERSRLGFLDTCLRRNGVPWPGNLDGFIIENNSIKCLFEFSRTTKNKVKDHDISKFFKQDYNRWKVLDVLKKITGAPTYIILWASYDDQIWLKKVGNFDFSNSQIVYAEQQLLNKDEIEEIFKKRY